MKTVIKRIVVEATVIFAASTAILNITAELYIKKEIEDIIKLAFI